MRVQAIRQGYYGDKLREQGDVFEMDGIERTKDPRFAATGVNCKWVMPAASEAKVTVKEPEPNRPPGAGPIPGTQKDKAIEGSEPQKAKDESGPKTTQAPGSSVM